MARISMGFKVGVGVGEIVGEEVGDGVALAVALGDGVAVGVAAGVVLGCMVTEGASPAGLRAVQATSTKKPITNPSKDQWFSLLRILQRKVGIFCLFVPVFRHRKAHFRSVLHGSRREIWSKLSDLAL